MVMCVEGGGEPWVYSFQISMSLQFRKADVNLTLHFPFILVNQGLVGSMPLEDAEDVGKIIGPHLSFWIPV
jgi:hypothetical protein